MLALWLGSGLVFAAGLNWTVSARSFLPVVPGVAMLMVRGLGASSLAGSATLPKAARPTSTASSAKWILTQVFRCFSNRSG